MQFFTVTLALLSATAFAAPAAEVAERQVYVPCSGLYSNAECCATDVLGVADLDCALPPIVPTDADNFSAICSAIGQRARCCVLPILGQAVLCETPAGVSD